MRNGLALKRYLRHFRRMSEVKPASRMALSRRFCVAPMMESENGRRYTLDLYGLGQGRFVTFVRLVVLKFFDLLLYSNCVG